MVGTIIACIVTAAISSYATAIILKENIVAQAKAKVAEAIEKAEELAESEKIVIKGKLEDIFER